MVSFKFILIIKKIDEVNENMNVMIIFGCALVIIGFYLILQAVKMKKTNEIAGNIVLSEEDVLKCKDKKGFISYIYGREVLTGVAVIVIGLALIVKELISTAKLPANVVIVIALIIILLFFNSLKEARNRFLY